MGYHTDYNLSAVNEDIKKILSDLREKYDSDSLEFDTEIFYVLDVDGTKWDEAKWYEHEDEMRAISKLYPEVVFKLKGEDEDSEDIWIKYFKNGKCQECHAEIVFEEYNEEKLA